MKSGVRGSKRLRGEVEDLASGALRVKVYAGIDPISKKRLYLRAAIKRRVGATASDIDEYGRGKNTIVQQILAAAGLTAAERASIDANQVPAHDDVPR